MNKKGFTLVELLAVIVLLSVILGITFPIVYDAIKQGKDTVNDTQISKILDAAYDWGISNPEYLPESGNSVTITLGQLKQEGLISTNLKNAETKKLFPNDMLITITNTDVVNKDLEYTKYIGDYKITANVDIGTETEYDEHAPQIILNGDSVMYVNKDTAFADPGISKAHVYREVSDGKYQWTSVSKSNVVITYQKGENDAVSISTSEYAVYYINYTLVEGTSKTTVVRTVIIVDNEPPTLTIPKSSTISTDVTTFDYTTGVSCADAQGGCTVTHDSTVKVGVKGKYVITYTATDDFGNTTVKKRVITIK